ncbi:MAG: methionyl-tRNA formyltransferase [Candidatus Shikimatogenerans sp. Tduv]|uniref:Formyltransferase family protein n=1 Tax=Candidatus Shikimatogenerans sp. Tduv TaxID=3158567 RepID=A0AAU7QS45_9FLAO
MKKNIIFLTNGNFSIPILNYLNNKYKITGIITNKYLFLKKKKIYNFIINNNINYLYDKYINNKSIILNFLKKNKPDINICISFKYIKKYIYEFPKYGTINLHPSLLPKYIGPNPIRYAILNNEKITGISIIKINNNIDKGKILIQKKIRISKKDSYYSLYNKLSFISIYILYKLLNKIFNNIKIKCLKINSKLYTYTKKNNYNKDCKINWNNKSLYIYNQIRAFYKKPSTWTAILLKNQNIKYINIKKSNYKIKKHLYKNGYIKIHKNKIQIYCKDGYLIIKKCKFINKKQHNMIDFINGFKNLNIIKCI